MLRHHDLVKKAREILAQAKPQAKPGPAVSLLVGEGLVVDLMESQPENASLVARPQSSLQPGATITWQRGDLTVQTGVVDFLYTDETATRWAFVTIGESWAAVNMKFAVVTTDASPLSTDVT